MLQVGVSHIKSTQSKSQLQVASDPLAGSTAVGFSLFTIISSRTGHPARHLASAPRGATGASTRCRLQGASETPVLPKPPSPRAVSSKDLAKPHTQPETADKLLHLAALGHADLPGPGTLQPTCGRSCCKRSWATASPSATLSSSRRGLSSQQCAPRGYGCRAPHPLRPGSRCPPPPRPPGSSPN